MGWANRATKTVPTLTSRPAILEINDYSMGYNSFLSNDKFPLNDGKANMLRLAQDARIITLGEYQTRKGFDFHSAPAGETADVSQTSTTGASNQAVSETVRVAKKITFTTTGSCSRIDVNIKNSASATGVVMVELWTNVSGAPGALLSRSSIRSSDIDTTYGYEIARFNDAQAVTATDYWAVFYVQSVGTNSYYISSTTNASTGLTSSNSGVTWGAASVDFNVKAYLSTTGGCKGLYRAYKSDGTTKTLMAHGTVLYSVDEVTGALTSVKTGLSASATDYRFETVNDIVYYVNGYDGYRKWDFTTESQVNSTNYTNIKQHKGLMFLQSKLDPNKVVFSNFADYETFTSTDFIYVPSPKTGDPVVGMVSLTGYLILQTRDNKYILFGEDNATFTLQESPDRRGTYSQETVVSDNNYMYFLSEDGVFRSNGTEAQAISESIYQEILDLENKDSCVMAITRGRLYLWYKSPGSDHNDKCYVWNLNLSSGSDTVESLDTGATVGRAVNAFRDDDDLLVASSVIGQAYWQELESNDYTNLGDNINLILQTHYMTFASPSVLKEIRYWQPRFEAQSSSYDISCEYAYDLRDNWQVYSSPDVQGSGVVYGGGAEYGDGSVYGTSAELQSKLYVPGEYRRIALRYKHYATRQPHSFLGHTLQVQTRRMR